MKRIGVLLFAALLAAGGAQAGTQVGFRAGWSDLDGSVFKGSGDVGGVGLFGIQAVFPVMPWLTLSLAGESRNESITFDDAGDPGQFFDGKAEWSDLALYASLRLRILPLGVGPAGIYAGGGLGAHLTETKIKPALDELSGEIEEFIDDAEGEESEISWHGIVGASFDLPVLPLSVFAETRLEDIGGDYQPKGYSIYGGVNLNLP